MCIRDRHVAEGSLTHHPHLAPGGRDVADHPQQPYFFLSEASIERRDILSEVAEVAAGLRVA